MKFRYGLVIVFASLGITSCAQIFQPITTNQEEIPAPVITTMGDADRTSTSENIRESTEVYDQEDVLSPTPTSPASSLPPSLPCSGILTSLNQEGPFYKAGSPERESLIEEGMPGTPILIMGRVFDQDCNPLPGVKVDFWLANVDGEYDNVGYTLRGHQFTDENGFYSIESIEPTPYTGRPSHIHVKLFAPNKNELLTTQMYFPGSESSPDVSNSPDLLVTYLGPDSADRQQVLFNFIVQDQQ